MVRRIAAGLLLLLLGSCNTYNPSGKGDPENTDEWIAQGQAQLRASQFDAAKSSFGHVLANDSDNVDAWTGYTKSVAGGNLDIGVLLKELLDAENQNRKPLWEMPLPGKNTLYHGIAPVLGALELWARRDSLHHATMGPDRVRERGFLTLAYAMLTLWDSNRDGNIDSTNDIVAITLFKTLPIEANPLLPGSGFTPNFTSTPNFFVSGTSGMPDTARIGQFNRLLLRVDTQFQVVKAIAKQDTAMAAAFKATDGLNPYALTSFQVGDGIDNDLDGCVDEEIADGVDNDGDRLIDEDTRPGYLGSATPIPGQTAQTSPSDGVNWTRLTSPWSDRGIPGKDSAITLQYASTAEYNDNDWPKVLLKVFLPLNPSFQGNTASVKAWQWNSVCRWTAKEADSMKLNLTLPCQDGAPFDWNGITRMELKQRMERTLPLPENTPRAAFNRVALGCKLIGGCWCRTMTTICDTTTRTCPQTAAAGYFR